MLIEAIDVALRSIDPRYCELSKIIYSQSEVSEYLAEEKYLERPFAYEFYHQFRKLLDEGRIDFGGSVIQAEVDKRYQHLEGLGKIPDFILHTPHSTDSNLAVIEFKLASNFRKSLESDLIKLVAFKRTEVTRYKYLVEVIIGNANDLADAWERIDNLKSDVGEEILIFGFDPPERGTELRSIFFEPNGAI
ncbi:MAG: hypothetical protein ACJ74W_04970 [Pyrinomonadaceae bacterium]